MGQTKKHSLIESTINIAIGYLVALASQLVIFPFYGIEISIRQNLAIGAWFTVISIIRSYALRRWFNGIMVRGATLLHEELILLREVHAAARRMMRFCGVDKQEFDRSYLQLTETVHDVNDFDQN